MGCNLIRHYDSAPMRWKFVDGSLPEEQRAKEAKLTKIDQFWHQFQQDSERLKPTYGRENGDFIVNWMERNYTVDPSLMWQLGRGEANRWILEITPESHVELRPIAQTFVERAPKISGWEFFTYRQPMPIETIASAFDERAHAKPPTFKVESRASGYDLVVLCFALVPGALNYCCRHLRIAYGNR